jgi:hypothetical protein
MFQPWHITALQGINFHSKEISADKRARFDLEGVAFSASGSRGNGKKGLSIFALVTPKSQELCHKRGLS